MELHPDGDEWDIKNSSCAFGGLAPKSILAIGTTRALNGQKFNPTTFERACAEANKEFMLPSGVPGGQAEYRTALAVSFIFKTFYIVNEQLRKYLETHSSSSHPDAIQIDDRDKSASISWVLQEKQKSRGEQLYHMRKGGLQRANPPHAADEVQKVGAMFHVDTLFPLDTSSYTYHDFKCCECNLQPKICRE